jgi:hypothetical protein
VLQTRPGQEILKQLERGHIEPLQVIEKQHQRLSRSGKHADESLEHTVKAALRVLERQLRNGRLFTDDGFQLRNEVDDELSVLIERAEEIMAPLA